MIILASNSPRRKELLGELGLPFRIHVIPDIDESYPDNLPAKDVAEYIAKKKAVPYTIIDGNTVLTADTIVVCNGDIMGKPKDADDAYRMLSELSGKVHQVYTGVCIKYFPINSSLRDNCSHPLCKSFTVCTDVTFKKLTDEEILHYIRQYKPYDKAGAYGIQEWIGYIGITNINGSYYNVMGLPVQRIYSELKALSII